MSNNVLTLSKKAFTWTVVVATIAWSVGLASFLQPLSAQAATLAAGDLIKASNNPAVYYYGADGRRYVFPTESTYKTWYADFSGVKTITPAELSALQLGGNVTMRPGVKLVKVTTDPKVYAIDANGTLRHIASESAALAVYGSNWNKMVVDLPDAFFTNYKFGAAINSAADFNASAATAAAASINANQGIGGSAPATPIGGSVTAMLATSSIGNGTVVTGQATANLGSFTFSGTGTLQSIQFTRTGVSSNSTLSNVYLYEGATRLSDAASVNSNGVITFAGVNLSVTGSRTLTVLADIDSSSSNSGQTIGVALTGYTVAGATQTLVNIPAALQSVTNGSGVLASVVIANGDNVAPYNNTLEASVNAGTMAYAVWSAPVQVNTRAVWLKAASFRFVGSASNDALQNLELFVNGTKVATAANVSANGYINFDLATSPAVLNTGSSTLEVRADIVKGSNRNFTISLQNAADLMVTDSQLMVNVSPKTSNTTQFLVSEAGQITVNSGTVTFNIEPAFQAMTNVTGGSANAVIARYRLTGYGEDVKVQSLSVTPALSGTTPLAAGLNNVALYFNGAQVGSSQNWTTGALTFQLGSSMIIPAGANSTLEVRADLQTSGNVNYTAGTVTVTVNAGLANGQGLTSLNTTPVPASQIATSGLTIRTGALSVARNTAYANQTLNPNTTGAKVGSFTLQNQSTSESVRVTSLAIGLTTDGTTVLTTNTTPALTNLSNLRTSETSGSGATPINPTASNNFSVDFTLAPGATKTVDILSDLGTATSGTIVATLLPTALGTNSNVTLTPGSATVGQTITLSSGSFAVAPTIIGSGTTSSQYIAASAGASDATKARFNFTASNGVAKISELKFAVKGAGTVESVKVGGITAPVVAGPTGITLGAAIANGSVTSITLSSTANIQEGQVLLIGSEELLVRSVDSSTVVTVRRGANSTSAASALNEAAVTVYGLAYLTGLDITVPNTSAGVNVDVFATYSPVGTNGTTSGTTSTLYSTFAKYTIGGTTGTTTSSSSANAVAAPTVTLVGARPYVTAAQPTNTTLAVGNIRAIDVTVKAESGALVLKTLPITATMTNASLNTSADTAIVQDQNGTTVATTNTAFGSAAGGTTTITFTGGYTLSANESQTFRIFFRVASVDDATIGGANNSQLATSLATGSGFSWTDTAGSAGSDQTGTLNILNYPNTITSVVRN